MCHASLCASGTHSLRGTMEDVNGCGGNGFVLQETFYILSKKNTVYRVKLSEKGLSLAKETNGNTKSETISLDDIIGCRCMRSKCKPGPSCVCRPSGRRAVEEPEKEEKLNTQDPKDISAYLYIYAYVLKKYKVTSGVKRERMTITLRFRSFDKFEENMREAQKWRLAIKCLMKGTPIPQSVLNSDENSITSSPGGTERILDERKVLVLLNPKSGPGRARDVFQQKVVPLLLEAELGYDLHISKHANFAREYVRTKDIYQYRAIITLGGDGIIFEVVNGLFERPDWMSAIKEVPIGIIPCGSGNGLAKSVAIDDSYDQNPVLFSTLNILKGNSTPLDLVRVETRSKIMYSFLSIGWGLLSDIDIESEKLRAIGGQRFTIWSLARLIGLRTYKGRISYLPHPNHKSPVQTTVSGRTVSLTRSASQMVDLDPISENGVGFMTPMHTSQSMFSDIVDPDSPLRDLSLETAYAKIAEDMSPVEQRSRMDSFYSVNSRRSTFYSIGGSSFQSVFDPSCDNPNGSVNVQMYGPPSQLPSLTQPVPESWKTIEGEFVMMHSTNVSHLAKDCLFAPDAKLSDGIIWLVVIEAGISRHQLLQFLLGLSHGTHLNCPHVKMLPVLAFRLEPETDGSYITVDGEVVEYGPIQAEVMPGLGRIISR